MTDIKDDGGPFHPPTVDQDGCPSVGASFRAVAAMHAMAAMMSASYVGKHASLCNPEDIAIDAVEYADALIAELKK